MGLQQESLNQCISKIYAAAMEPSLWDSFLQSVSTEVRGTMSLLIFGSSRKQPESFFIHHNAPEDCLAIYREHYFLDNDLYYRAIKQYNLAGKVFIGSEYIPDDFLRSSAMYHDFL